MLAVPAVNPDGPARYIVRSATIGWDDCDGPTPRQRPTRHPPGSPRPFAWTARAPRTAATPSVRAAMRYSTSTTASRLAGIGQQVEQLERRRSSRLPRRTTSWQVTRPTCRAHRAPVSPPHVVMRSTTMGHSLSTLDRHTGRGRANGGGDTAAGSRRTRVQRDTRVPSSPRYDHEADAAGRWPVDRAVGRHGAACRTPCWSRPRQTSVDTRRADGIGVEPPRGW